MTNPNETIDIEVLKAELSTPEIIQGMGVGVHIELADIDVWDEKDFETMILLKEHLAKFCGQGRVTIGRRAIEAMDPDSPTVGKCKTMSRDHFGIGVDRNKITLTDLNSTHGTFVLRPHDTEPLRLDQSPKTILLSALELGDQVTIEIPTLVAAPTSEQSRVRVVLTKLEEVRNAPEKPAHKDSAGKVEKSPNKNVCEDVVLHEPDIELFAVFDGVSDPPGGEKAAQIASETISKYFQEKKQKGLISTKADAGETMRNALQHADEAVARLKNDVRSTAAAIYLHKEAEKTTAIIGSTGDSRVYLVRDTEIFQLTKDDISILDGLAKKYNMSENELRWLQQELSNAQNKGDVYKITQRAEYKQFVKRAENLETEFPLADFWERGLNKISGALGKRDKNSIHVISQTVLENDILILATDGVIGCKANLTLEQLRQITVSLKHKDAQTIVTNIMGAAKFEQQKGGVRSHYDDATVEVIKI